MQRPMAVPTDFVTHQGLLAGRRFVDKVWEKFNFANQIK
jgi:hypothetical protein